MLESEVRQRGGGIGFCLCAGLDAKRGKRYSWGYPACPDLEDHQQVLKLLPDAATKLGMSLTTAYQRSYDAVTVETMLLSIVGLVAFGSLAAYAWRFEPPAASRPGRHVDCPRVTSGAPRADRSNP